MVLRRPYGFLIKHFRLIHLIITVLLVLVLLRNQTLYGFLNDCIDDSINRYNANSYINYTVFIYLLLGIGLFMVIYYLFKFKDKPRTVYVVSIGCYVAIGVFILILYNYLSDLPSNVMEQKTVRAYRDIMLVTLIVQYVIIAIMFVRGLGFNIKQFNFGKDIQELNLVDTDYEEVEVNLSVDTTNVMREFNRRKREFGYFYQEYKVFILGIGVIILVIGGVVLYNTFKDILKVYHEGDVVGTDDYVSITDSYYSVSNEKNYVIVKFDVSHTGKSKTLDLVKFVLNVNGKKYYPNKNICSNFYKLGSCYKTQYITSSTASYLITYEVESLNIGKSYILYQDGYENSYKIKLDLENYVLDVS